MLIRKLKNPLTEEYISFKNNILFGNFPWFFANTTKNDPSKYFLCHSILKRPEQTGNFLSHIDDLNCYNSAVKIIKDISLINNLKITSVLRIAVNCSFCSGSKIGCLPHVDHKFPHKNLLMYLNTCSGSTIVFDPTEKTTECFEPEEDAIILFEGKHYYFEPKMGEKRITIITTFV